MATILLGAAGAAIGGAIGGTVIGLSSAVIGRAVGASLGRALDQRLLGAGSSAVDVGQIDRFRLTGASEASPVAQMYGRLRVGGQVIWAAPFQETVAVSGGGKGAPPQPATRNYSYSVSMAVALCEGEITTIGRVWADGVEVAPDSLNMRIYQGTQDQMPDPKIEAIEGAGNAPAYRGIAYVVFEDIDLGPFGNRVPQMTFEVLRPAPANLDVAQHELSNAIKGVALIPGSGEYALATTPVYFSGGFGLNRSANTNSPSGKTDFETSVQSLSEELPNCGATSLVVSWFGNDLRCGTCSVQPKVEQKLEDGAGMAWNVSGVTRVAAGEVPLKDGKSVYGGTPTDTSVYEAILHLKSIDQDVVLYPFILMEQLEGNGLPDPWSDATDQPELPWRGRITLSDAPGRVGSPDGTAAAEIQVADFFGAAQPGDFSPVAGADGRLSSIAYSGPTEWGYRRMVLHYAHLCAFSGGVDAFCLGSELRGLTQVRGAGGSFPFVEALIALAADVRAILGPDVKISYAADWSEYFGYHPQDGTGDVLFHLDPLWSDDNIDFIGIDNYMPLADWRDGDAHLDAEWGSIHNTDYLRSNVAGGEGYDWYYHSDAARDAQIRTPISDGAYGEPWVFRVKDLKSWWSNTHHNRIGGVRDTNPTDWLPETKPIWFTEIGCGAIDKGANQPNKFLDPKSSESDVPYFSNGGRDELMQLEYFHAIYSHWDQVANNPVSDDTGVQMVDMSRAMVWAWDTRPFPFFPNNLDLWSDGENYARGHWINGRASGRSLASVVTEICARSGVEDVDVSRLYGYVRGYGAERASDAREALQPLMLAHGFDAVEREGILAFRTRDGRDELTLDQDALALTDEQGARVEKTRAPTAETSGRVRLSFVEADGDYQVRAEEAIFPDEVTYSVSQSEISLVLTRAEGRAIAERWLSESRVARDGAKFALPPSKLHLGAGDIVGLQVDGAEALYRIDHVEQSGAQLVDAVRVEPGIYIASDATEEQPLVRPFTPAVPVFPVFLDLPLVTETEQPHAPYLAVTAKPWPGTVAAYSSASDSGYGLNKLLSVAATIGATLSPLFAAPPAIKDNTVSVRVKLTRGTLASASWADVLNGANAAAIGDGSSDNWEIFQFETATLVAEDTYDLSGRLRGQFGSDALIPSAWPTGSTFVLLDSAMVQIDLASSARDLARYYRIGPAARSYDDPSYVERIEAFKGIGLRPYSPAHLATATTPGGDVDLSWIRRTRIDGDSWSSVEVPLGEEIESYLVRVVQGVTVVREVTVGVENWTYSQADILADGTVAPYDLRVAQVSNRFGPGLFGSVTVGV